MALYGGDLLQERKRAENTSRNQLVKTAIAKKFHRGPRPPGYAKD